ncbi:MAG: hypothetical protein M1823_000545 [Watsoniomyces obsoletus]|nr:MAG: hypothetical protein M1823_000545 [Watsoniomyces obsoletus]
MSNQSLVRRSTDTELMPPPPTKRIKRPPKVLDEDSYTEALSMIIARDFFPGLLETQSQQEYLDALTSQDQEWIASAGRRLTEVMTPGRTRGRRGTSMARSLAADTPRGEVGDTPMSVLSTATTDTTVSKKEDIDLNLSLGGFQAKYTSEDNESFNKLLDKQNTKRAERYAWLWAGNKIPSSRQIMQRERRQQQIGDGEGTSTSNTTKLIEGAGDERKAMPDTWKAKPDNQAFFVPEGIEDEYETVQQAAEAKSKAPPRAIVHDNTRLPPAPETVPTVPPSPSLSAIQDAIAGRPRPTASEPGFEGGSTPRVNGYTFVDDEPTPAEEISHARLLGNGGDGVANPFKIHEQSKRESLHHRMVDRVAKRNRTVTRATPGTMSSVGTPTTISGTPRVSGNLTPAAQRLWTKLGTPGMSGSGAFGTPGTKREVHVRWTPTPKQKVSKEKKK